VRLLEELIGDMRDKGSVWFARGREIANYFSARPAVRRAIDFDALENPPLISK
jgi:hypothetical protein